MKEEFIHQRIKELALEYKDSESSSIFREILLWTEKLLTNIISGAVRRKPYLEQLEKQDRYHAAILGLHKAILKVKKEESSGILISRIIFYVDYEVTCWGNPSREKPLSSLDILNEEEWPPWVKGVWSGGSVKQFYDEPVYKNLESEFIRDIFKKLIEEKVISFKDFELLVMREVNEMTYEEIAEQVGYSATGIRRKIKMILDKLRNEFRKRGWDNVFWSR